MNSAPIDALGKIVPAVKGQVQVAPKQEPGAGPTPPRGGPDMDRIVVSPEAIAKSIQMRTQTSEQDASSSVKQVGERVREMVNRLQSRATSVQFSVEELNGEVLIQIVNKASGEVVRQIPPEEILNLQDQLRELNGLLFDEVS